MTGTQTADNKFGPTPFIVGKIKGDGCNFGGATAIQDAIDAAFAAGGGEVLIRPDTTPYVENLTLRPNVNIVGFTVDGRIPNPIDHVSITGSHTFTATSGFDICIARDIAFSSPAGTDVLTVIAPAGTNCLFACKECTLSALNPGDRAVVLNADVGASCSFNTDGDRIEAANHCVDMIGPGSQNASIQFGANSAGTGSVINMGAGSCSGQLESTDAGGTYLVTMAGTLGNFLCRYTNASTTNEIINNVTPGASIVEHSSFSSGAASGFWIAGAGTLSYADLILTGGAIAIDPLVLTTVYSWQPYGETAVMAAGSNRGTSSYDSASFTVTDGWVQLSGSAVASTYTTDSGSASPVAGVLNIFGGPGVTTSAGGNTVTVNSLIWTDIVGPTTVTRDSGTFDTGAGTTITLPAIMAQGEEVRIFSFAVSTVVQAQGADVIQIGNQTSSAGGTATSSATGDSLILVYNLAINRFCSVATNGNWTLA